MTACASSYEDVSSRRRPHPATYYPWIETYFFPFVRKGWAPSQLNNAREPAAKDGDSVTAALQTGSRKLSEAETAAQALKQPSPLAYQYALEGSRKDLECLPSARRLCLPTVSCRGVCFIKTTSSHPKESGKESLFRFCSRRETSPARQGGRRYDFSFLAVSLFSSVLRTVSSTCFLISLSPGV